MAEGSAQNEKGHSRKGKRGRTCTTYLEGAARKAHRLRQDLEVAMETSKESPSEPTTSTSGTSSSACPCTSCKPVLEKLKPTFTSLVRRGRDLRHRKRVMPEPRKPDKPHYRNLVEQNKWIRSSLFDALGNYRYCPKCISRVLGIGTQRLAHQRAIKRRQALIPVVDMTKPEVETRGLKEFAVVPDGFDCLETWWQSLRVDHVVQVQYPHSGHGLARKTSNNAKGYVKDDFLKFVDTNSQPNGRNASSFGPQFYFLPQYTRIGEPKRGEGERSEKSQRSLICEFNRAQLELGRSVCSDRSAFRWLKEHRPKHAICPHRTDYCDVCKQLNEEINRQKTVLQRLRHAGNSSDSQLREHEATLEQAKNDLSEHKLKAQKALEHYRFTTEQCARDWKAIVDLSAKDSLNEDEIAQLERRKASFVLVLSADYQMTKLIPQWGVTAQPGISYYLRKVSHDLFGIIDHRDGTNFVPVFSELVGPKNTDHTVSLLLHYLCHSGLVPSWIKRVCIFLDNASSTNKNRYLLGWAMELVQHQVFDLIRLPFLIPGHTKFAPDRLFASIGSAYGHSDVFNIEELVEVAARFGTAFEETGVNVLHWRQELDKKYVELNGIRQYHDFFITRNSARNAELRVREDCSSGTPRVTELKLRKGQSADVSCFPSPSSNYHQSRRTLSEEKMSDMYTMYSRFIPPERWPAYLQSHPQSNATAEDQSSQRGSGGSRLRQKKHCSTPGCDGSGHKNIVRWAEGHTTRAGCPIYHNISPP